MLDYDILTAECEGAFYCEPQNALNGERVQVGFGYNGLAKEGEALGHFTFVTILKSD